MAGVPQQLSAPTALAPQEPHSERQCQEWSYYGAAGRRRPEAGSVKTLPDRLAALLPYPRLVRPQRGHFALGPHTPVLAGPEAGPLADAMRTLLAALPWPPSEPPSGPSSEPSSEPPSE